MHCYSRHNFRQKNPKQGAYIRQLKVRGPVFDQWPPASFAKAFEGLQVDAPPRKIITDSPGFQSNLQKIGGKLSVSSFQPGMEKEKMQDGTNRTFWHTRFKPTLAQPPHYVIVENPHGKEITGLSYATWTGGNGNGHVKAYEVYISEDGQNWGQPIMDGVLDIRLSNEQPIIFPRKTTARFIKFQVTAAKSTDERFLASIGKLDVIAAVENKIERNRILVASDSADELEKVIRRFAETAFSTRLNDAELAPYLQVGLDRLSEDGDFVHAAKASFKAVTCSPRFLMAPGEHANPSYQKAADLTRSLWLSVPDSELIRLCKTNSLSDDVMRVQINRMISDEKFQRMVHSFCDQWLNLRSWNKVVPSLKLYPKYNDLLDYYLPVETRTYLRHLIQENQPVTELIDSDYSFLNQRLAQHYGIEGIAGQHLRKVSFFSPKSPGGTLDNGKRAQGDD